MNLFDNINNQYVLFSGTSFEDEQGVFRHINDLFFILYILYVKDISKENIILACDIKALNYLNKKTNNKKVKLIDNRLLTYIEMINTIVGDIINVIDFEKDYKNDKDKNLIFLQVDMEIYMDCL